MIVHRRALVGSPLHRRLASSVEKLLLLQLLQLLLPTSVHPLPAWRLSQRAAMAVERGQG